MNVRSIARPAVALFAMGFLAACSNSPGPAYSAAIQEGQTAAQEVLRQGSTTSLGIALVTPDRIVWAESFGLADLDARRAPTETTMFGIGSVSKMFAAVAVMQLVERGLVDLDAPLVRYVPSFRMADPRFAEITVRMLLAHSSGLPGSTYRNAEATSPLLGYEEQVVAALAEERLKAPPGYMSVYCNDGFSLVETLVMAVTGKSYAEYVQAEILTPLGMAHSSYTLAPFSGDSYAKFFSAGVVQSQEFIGPQASGGLYTTPTDMAALVRVFLNGGTVGKTRILQTSSVEAMGANQTLGTFNPAPSPGLAYGLGWDTVTESGLQAVGITGWGKNGGIANYLAQIVVAPQAGLGVVVMGTAGAGFDTLAIAQRVLLRALSETGRIPSFPDPLPPVAAPVAPVPDGMLATISGEYAAGNAVYRLHPEENGSLTLLAFDGKGFSPARSGLLYRSDGWFTSEAAPLVSYRVVEGGGTQYLALRFPGGTRHFLDQMLYAQRVRGKSAPLSPSWSGRVGSTWLLVNERPDSLMFLGGAVPRFGLTTSPELVGLVIAYPPDGSPYLLDPSLSDIKASMMLVLPGNFGRDMNDLDVVVKGGEEWVRWGDAMHRPLATVPLLPPGATTLVSIGPDGYAEWRAVKGGAAPLAVTVAGAVAWRFYSPDFQLLGSGGATGQVTMPAGEGLGHLMLFGAPGTSVGVTVE
jgi:CubicO group peptidase (beta-lactamase class C family)